MANMEIATITGASGEMGGAVAKELLEHGVLPENTLLHGVRSMDKLRARFTELGIDLANYQITKGGLWEKRMADLPDDFKGKDAVMFNIASGEEDALNEEGKPAHSAEKQADMTAEEVGYTGDVVENFSGRVIHAASTSEVLYPTTMSRFQTGYGLKKSEISKMMDESGREDLDRIVAGYMLGGLMPGEPEGALRLTNMAIKMAKRNFAKLPDDNEGKMRADELAQRLGFDSFSAFPEQVRPLTSTEVAKVMVSAAAERVVGGSYTPVLGDQAA